jgi:hypothetical protein
VADWVKSQLLALLRVPPEPHPPQGSPESLRTFRAGRNYYKWRIAVWAFGNFAMFIVLAMVYLITYRPLAELPPLGQQIATLVRVLIWLGFGILLLVSFLIQKLNYDVRLFFV